MKKILYVLICISILSCSQNLKLNTEVNSISAMKNVMWKGELEAKVKLDTLQPKTGLFGIGPLEGLSGEITIYDGQVYVSTINDDNLIEVKINPEVGAPFFVYANAYVFEEINLPKAVSNLKQLNDFLSKKYDRKHAYVFKLIGEIQSGKIHVQNLPPNTKVSSPKEAHQGQVDFEIGKTAVEMIGFYSNSAKGIYTHHDTNIHVHLISQDKNMMGHCDEVIFNSDDVKLYLATTPNS